MKVSARNDWLVFSCEHCTAETLRASGKSDIDHMRGFRRFQRAHQNCKIEMEFKDRRDEASEMATAAIARAQQEPTQ